MTGIEILAWIGALFIGIVLGLIGGGGSILTVPVLVYLLGINPIAATAYSLFVVGTTSLVGTIKNLSKGIVNIKVAVLFSIPAFIAVFVARRFILPAIPNEIINTNFFVLDKNTGIMLLFAVIMLAAAISMMRKRKESSNSELKGQNLNYPLIMIEGALVGVLTGIVGAGGGFLIIPALVLLAKLPMKEAVATSLLIISVKSLIGFLGDIGQTEMNWNLLLSFTGLSILGILIGTYLSNFISGKKLKKGFAVFVLMMAFYILWKELA